MADVAKVVPAFAKAFSAVCKAHRKIKTIQNGARAQRAQTARAIGRS
jgi:uncharacterized protein YaaN involved in tellurite resistance